MYTHIRTHDASRPLVEMNNVSKQFALNRGHQRSIQEKLTQLFRKNRARDNDYFWSVKDISLSLWPGDSIGLIGPNGSGKSTLLKLITGIIEPSSGDVAVNGPFSSLLELGAGFHPELTGRENIFLNASIYGLSRNQISERLDSIIGFSELGRFIDVPVKHYSSGMYVRLGFAVAIHTDPKLLLVDEVLAVGDARFQAKCMQAIHKFRNNGGTLMLVSHDLTAIQAMCNRALWISEGVVQAQGAPTDVIMAYIRRLAKSEHSDNSVAGDQGNEKRWGNFDVEVVSVEFCDHAGEAKPAFFTGQPMEIRLRYVAKKRVPNVVFGIGLYHESGVHICGPNTGFGGLSIPYVEGAGEVVYRIPSLPLLEGAYEMALAVTDEQDTIFYDYHDRLHRFRVFPGESMERYGLFTMQGHWSLESAAHANGLVGKQSEVISVK